MDVDKIRHVFEVSRDVVIRLVVDDTTEVTSRNDDGALATRHLRAAPTMLPFARPNGADDDQSVSIVMSCSC